MSQDTQNTPTRDARGQFAGAAPVLWHGTVHRTDFVPSKQVSSLIERVVREFVSKAQEWAKNTDQEPPVLALAPSPGSGKSTTSQAILAALDDKNRSGNVEYYAPTIALGDEIARRSKHQPVQADVFRGRTAEDPANPGQKMCAKSDMADAIGKLGLPVRPLICERAVKVNGHRETRLCDHHHSCAYIAQFADNSSEPRKADRVGSHSHLTTGIPGANDPWIRVIDEKFWAKQIRIGAIPVQNFVDSPRIEPSKWLWAATDAQAKELELQRVARDLVQCLETESSLLRLNRTAEEIRALADDEMSFVPDPFSILPDQSKGQQQQKLQQYARLAPQAKRRAMVWRAVAKAIDAGVEVSERLILSDAQYKSANGTTITAKEIRVYSLAPIKDDRPALVLDADANKEILSAFFDQVDVTTAELEPNAQIIQVSNLRFSDRSLLTKPALRDRLRRLIEQEVERNTKDIRGGVLVGATKKVVRKFFEDAGVMAPGMDDASAAKVMLTTKLLGANWLWYGDRGLGINHYENHGTVIAIGRQELPVHVLEDQGRAIFGDTEQPLQLVKADEDDNVLIPEMLVPYEFRDGRKPVAIPVRVHPDPRIRLIQRQHREYATRQLVERLRLARATTKKRVILCCNIPIPGLPVDQLAHFDELAPEPTRLERALHEVAGKHRTLMLSASMLPGEAPQTFRTQKCAENWLRRLRKDPTQLHQTFGSKIAGFTPVLTNLKRSVRYARKVYCFVLIRDGEDPRDVAWQAYGDLLDYEVCDVETAFPFLKGSGS